MISYYDLLGMVKDGTQPKQIKYYDKIYKWGYSNYVSVSYTHLTLPTTSRV